MPAKNKMLNRLSNVYIVRDKTGTFGSTTLTAAEAAGDTVLNVAATTNFAVGDLIRVGAGEDMELAVVSAVDAMLLTITVDNGLTYAHASGEAVVEQDAFDLGDVSAGGVTITHNGEQSDLMVATKRLVYATLDGYLDATCEFRVPNLTPWTLAFALGIPLSKMYGNGTANTPYNIATDGNQVGTEINMSVIAIGTLHDGTTVRCELWGCDLDYTSLAFKIARGQETAVPFKLVASAGGVATTNAAGFTGNNTYKATKTRVINALTEVGVLVAETVTPGDSTVASGGAAGTNTVTLAAGTNFAAGDWVKFGSGDTVEYHRIQNVAGAVLTLYTNFLRSQAVGTTAKEFKENDFASVDEGGVDVSVGGSVKKIRIGTRRRTAGLIPGAVVVNASFMLQEISLSMLAYALGIAQTDISGGRLPLGDNIGKTDIDAVYVKGTNENAENVWLLFWGCSQDISNLALTMAQAEASKVPLRVRPASGVQAILSA